MNLRSNPYENKKIAPFSKKILSWIWIIEKEKKKKKREGIALRWRWRDEKR